MKLNFNKSYTASSSDLSSLNIASFYQEWKQCSTEDTRDEKVAEYSKFWNLKKKPWFMPQLSAYFPKNFPAVKRDGLFNLAATLGSMNDFSKGCCVLANEGQKSLFITNMAKDPEYCSLVPTILGGYKRLANIPYSSWDAASLKSGMPSDLHKCILVDKEKYMQDLLEFAVARNIIEPGVLVSRIEVLRAVRSALGAGVAYQFSVAGSPYSSLPKLFRYIELQAWVAHPNIRTKYMILDLDNLDNMPEPLESSRNLLKEPTLEENDLY